MLPIRIKGTGTYAPGEAIDNSTLMQLAGITFDAEKIETKIGIRTRHIAHLRGLNETTVDFAEKAVRNALKDAEVNPEEVGLFILATDTPEYITPAGAILLQGRIQKGERWSMAFDVAASCASFTMALEAAANLLTSAEYSYAVVVGVYNMPAFIRPGDSFGYSIFADGAAAFVLEKSGSESAYIGSQMLTDGTQYDYIGIYAGGSKMPVTHQVLDEQKNGLLSLQALPGDRNVRLWPMMVRKLLNKYQTPVDTVDHFIFTQINKSVIEKVMNELEQPMHKTTLVMDRYGYTGSACVGMAFHEAVKSGAVKRGDRVVCMASGAGLAVGSNLFIY